MRIFLFHLSMGANKSASLPADQVESICAETGRRKTNLNDNITLCLQVLHRNNCKNYMHVFKN